MFKFMPERGSIDNTCVLNKMMNVMLSTGT